MHSPLRRHCRHLAPRDGAYLAIDKQTDRAVNLTRRPVMGIASAYQLVVGEIDDDWDYDPDTLRNTRFLTARFYLLKRGIADLRRLIEAAAIRDADDITTMATAMQNNLGANSSMPRVHRARCCSPLSRRYAHWSICSMTPCHLSRPTDPQCPIPSQCRSRIRRTPVHTKPPDRE
ncbi:hypothetical protein [Nocardia salmonicida]|uniref:hypothetical protein n=1 Tax=Nocardia salmonicida TaxID=53431 RepID=UPI000AAAE589|nr:hypothetical protein [Nocardia salmonicida]